ncbi:MAG TPA: hypothetical protein VLH10_26000 [Yinghuangia sp.]|uniref:hypothetical protein n=1 Tax=Yinghuangia sp. YIM S10712 TaxID=3436930 RepID=UPI002B570DA8|nr:hypothetical protein [Yinghuangia sp.]
MKAKTRLRSLGAAAGLAVCLSLVPTTQAHAAILVPCGNITALRAAINAANATGEDIALAPFCTYTLTQVDSTLGGSGLPVISGDVTIGGLNTTIARSSAANTPFFRIFHVDNGGALALRGINVRNGLTGGYGGGIENHGTLDVRGGAITGNTGTNAGGVYNAVDGDATLSATTVSGNRASVFDGGGILNTGTLRLNSTTVQGNTAVKRGGGLGVFDGSATLIASRVTGNTASTADGGLGGGIWEAPASTVTLLFSTVTNNVGGNCRPAGSVPGCSG